MKKSIALALSSCMFFTSFNLIADDDDKDEKKGASNYPAVSYVSFESTNLESPDSNLLISGQLRIPTSASETSKVPAVVVLHGSSGIDSRGSFYIERLNKEGIATLEIDMWAARGLTGGANRPALPSLTVPDAFSALEYLSNNTSIDSENIGVIGFSWGGVVSLLAATQDYSSQFGNGKTFASHIAHYPVCWAYNIGIPGINFERLTGEPVLIQIGDKDDYDEGAAPCLNLVASLPEEQQSLVDVNVYKNAFHAWDRLQSPIVVTDSFSHLGQGGEVIISPNKGAAHRSRESVVEFFEDTLDD